MTAAKKMKFLLGYNIKILIQWVERGGGQWIIGGGESTGGNFE